MASQLPGEERPESLEHLCSVSPTTSTDNSSAFISKAKSIRAGNSLPVAFGGCVQGIVINAAASTVDPSFNLFGFHGIFLGPTLTTLLVTLVVTPIRSTRTFQTRQITARQTHPDGTIKDVYHAIADFMILEPTAAPMLYSPKPRLDYSKPDQCPDYKEHLLTRVQNGTLDAKLVKAFDSMFGSFTGLQERRVCPESVAFGNLWGVDRHAITAQEGLPISDKTSAWWVRTTHPLREHSPGSAMHRAILAFAMDAGTSFIPLTHSHRFFEVVSAASSLDVSLKITCGEFRIDQWVLFEISSEAGGDGRTIAVVRAFREDGRLIAIATQNCIMRWKKDAELNLPRL
ncbi:hypothetical protein MBLNU459_g6420t1 [Dothideomycetes sp. NU459]